MATALLELFGGLLLLVVAADWLVDGAVAVARRLGVSMVVVGLTIVAYGTSFPEFVVSLISSSRGVADFAIGNIVGSNVANIGLVLGTTALVMPFKVTSKELFRRDMPILTVTTLLAVVFFMGGTVGRAQGLVLVAIAVGFTIVSLKTGGDELDEAEDEDQLAWGKALGLLLVGGAGLMVGAHFMVEGGTFVARHFGISERVIGLTIVAVGTSLPELAASVASALKGHPGLAVGNVVGSCLFNLTFVLGASGTISPLTADAQAMTWDLATMGGLTVLMWMVLGTGRRLSRVEGAALVTIYAGYLGYLVVTTVQGTAA